MLADVADALESGEPMERVADSSERGNEIASVFGTRVERWDIRSDPEATIYFASGP
jgi:hypothetical protein